MKTGNIKGTFSPQMGTLKDNSARDLVDTEEIKKKWKEYMEELYVKDPNEPDFYDGVVSHSWESLGDQGDPTSPS